MHGGTVEIDIEQCRENDKIKKIISTSNLPIKYMKILLRLSDSIYLNALNYNILIENIKVSIILISSKPQNKTGHFNTTSLTNVLYKLREMERENEEITTACEVRDELFHLVININI